MSALPKIEQLKGRTLGRILVKMGILTRDRVHHCLKIQKQRDENMSEMENKKVKGIIVVILLIITGAASTTLLLPTVESQFSYDVNVFQNYDELYTFYENIAENPM